MRCYLVTISLSLRSRNLDTKERMLYVPAQFSHRPVRPWPLKGAAMRVTRWLAIPITPLLVVTPFVMALVMVLMIFVPSEKKEASANSDLPSVFNAMQDPTDSRVNLDWNITHTSGNTTYIPVNREWMWYADDTKTTHNEHMTFAVQRIIKDFTLRNSDLELIDSPVFFIQEKAILVSHNHGAVSAPYLHGILLTHREKAR